MANSEDPDEMQHNAAFQQGFHHLLRQNQGSHGQGKVREKLKKFKVREKSGNFELSQGNLIFWQKSGKSQGILESEVEMGEIRF